MQTHPPPPLSIPCEDNLPLFDPSGLCTSVSTSAAPEDSSILVHGATPSSPDNDAEKRCRRRRSSSVDKDQEASVRSPLGGKQTSVGSKVRMWWDRSAETDQEGEQLEEEQQEEQVQAEEQAETRSAEIVAKGGAGRGESPSGMGAAIPDSKGMSPLAQSMYAEKRPQPRVDTSVQAGPSHSFVGRAESPEVFVSPMARSPAADFLSSFSSLHSVVASPPSSVPGHEARSISYSPPRPGQRGPISNIAREERRVASSPIYGGWHGLGSAAARLYGEGGSEHTINSGNSPCPDDEGARVGPRGRYLLGKTIGFGGFSTVREAWDLEAEGTADSSVPIIDGETKGRKVAIKIVYRDESKGNKDEAPKDSHELDVWRSLPSHLHLLPLLHSEEVTLPSNDPDSTKSRHAELLVMPFCDEGNLLDFVRSQGGSRTDLRPPSVAASEAGGSPFVTSLSRRNSLNNNGSYTGQTAGSMRTGSGFLSRINRQSSLNRVVSASSSMQSALNPSPLQLNSTSSSPVSASGSSGLLRRTSSKTTRSNGIPIEAARETMRQVASALLALHTKAKVLHGDLKLENVLGQGQTSTWKQRSRKLVPEATADDEATAPASPTTSIVSSSDGLFDIENTMPCWRMADFGLARRVENGRQDPSPSRVVGALKEGAVNASESHPGRGGSLAYTAPEYLRGGAHPEAEGESPYASDMWALGCILYALLSGRLPFADSFEPRLQMKIAKAQWEVPPRLKRRAERLAATATPGARHSRERSGSIGLSADMGKASLGMRSDASWFGPARASTLAASVDLSASLPSLPPRDRPANTSAPSMLPIHSEHVVGSAPGRADHPETNEAKAMANAEVDAESDNDETVDPAWDGLSWDRAAARKVLYGLLETEPSKRWTIQHLCSSAWLKDDSLALPSVTWGLSFASLSQLSGVTALRADVHDEAPTRRPSLITQSISERPSQEAIQTLDFSKRPTSPSRAEGRRTSSLARLRLTELDSRATSPLDDISIRERSESRSHSTAPSESSTPSRHDLWQIQRTDSPAERDRNSRPRMADLDENRMWTANPSDRLRISGPVPIPSRSRSRSRHSQGETDRIEVQRSSTSRSRSRAPDILASILSRDRSSSSLDLIHKAEEPRGRARQRS